MKGNMIMFGSRLFSNTMNWMMQEMALAQKNRDAEERYKSYQTYSDGKDYPEVTNKVRDGSFFNDPNHKEDSHE